MVRITHAMILLWYIFNNTYLHMSNNHSLGYKNKTTKVHTNVVEGNWGGVKLDLRKYKGIAGEWMHYNFIWINTCLSKCTSKKHHHLLLKLLQNVSDMLGKLLRGFREAVGQFAGLEKKWKKHIKTNLNRFKQKK